MFLWTDADIVEEHAAFISSVEVSRFRNRLVLKGSFKEGGHETHGEGVREGTWSKLMEEVSKKGH